MDFWSMYFSTRPDEELQSKSFKIGRSRKETGWPKNYYNLINQKAREAELSLIQFQYDGPLPLPTGEKPFSCGQCEENELHVVDEELSIQINENESRAFKGGRG